MSVEKEILKYLNKNKKPIRYKGMAVGLFGLPDFKYYKYQTLANKASLLQKKGYIKRDKIGNYYVTLKGMNFLETDKDFIKNFKVSFDKNAPKNLMVIYDIPYDKRKERDWFRRHLKNFGFIMIQKSVWVGPSPLPKEFLEYVKEIKLGDNFKTFKLAKGYK